MKSQKYLLLIKIKVINKKTEKEDTVNENDNFKYSDAIDYKKAIKEGQKEFDGDIKEWSLEKMMANLFTISI